MLELVERYTSLKNGVRYNTKVGYGFVMGILRKEEEVFFNWYDGKDLVPLIQRVKAAAGADVSARMTPVLRKARLGDDSKAMLSREVAGASERMLNHLLFGMRARLPDDVFRECLEAMEHVINE